MSDCVTPERQRQTSGFSLLLVVAICVGLQSACVSKSNSVATSQSTDVQDKSVSPVNSLLFNGGPTLARAEAGQGLLWFPFVWQPQLIVPEKDSGLTVLDSLSLRDPRLVLRNNRTKAEILIDLREEVSPQLRRFEMRNGESKRALRFYLPRVLALSQGEYTVESLRLEIGALGQDAATLVNMPFVNPFHASASKPLVFSIKEGKTAALARIVQTTDLAQAVQGLSLKSSSESLDRDVIPVDVVLNQTQQLSSVAVQSIVSATNDFPRMRINLTDENGSPQRYEEVKAKAGFLLDVPCSAEGTLRFVWKRQNDEREYLTQFPLRKKDEPCTEKQTIGHSFSLPGGDWVLKSSMIAEVNSFNPDVQTIWMKSPTSTLKDYFSLSQLMHRWSLETSREREIRRALLVQLDSLGRRNNELRTRQDVFRGGSFSSNQQILFLGHFEIRNSEAKNDKVNVWETFLRPSFTLDVAQTKLGSKEIYNAYTLERLTRGRSLKVNTVMRTASDQEDLPSVKSVAAEFRGEASKAFAACLHAREESDPLVNMGGELRFTVLKGSDSVTLKKLKIGEDGLSDKWVESCLEKKLLSFRFSKKVPANFQGELKFSSE